MQTICKVWPYAAAILCILFVIVFWHCWLEQVKSPTRSTSLFLDIWPTVVWSWHMLRCCQSGLGQRVYWDCVLVSAAKPCSVTAPPSCVIQIQYTALLMKIFYRTKTVWSRYQISWVYSSNWIWKETSFCKVLPHCVQPVAASLAWNICDVIVIFCTALNAVKWQYFEQRVCLKKKKRDASVTAALGSMNKSVRNMIRVN